MTVGCGLQGRCVHSKQVVRVWGGGGLAALSAHATTTSRICSKVKEISSISLGPKIQAASHSKFNQPRTESSDRFAEETARVPRPSANLCWWAASVVAYSAKIRHRKWPFRCAILQGKLTDAPCRLFVADAQRDHVVDQARHGCRIRK